MGHKKIYVLSGPWLKKVDNPWCRPTQLFVILCPIEPKDVELVLQTNKLQLNE